MAEVLDVRSIDFKTGMQFDVGGEYIITIFNAFPTKIQSRMDSDDGMTEDVFMTREEFGEMLHEIETSNDVKFIKESGNTNRYIIAE